MDMNTHRPAGTNTGICFDKRLFERYGGRGPRYTSYPTALQFHPAFGEADYRRIATDSNASGRPLSLYVHVPFCQSLCYYCGCNKIVTRNAERIQAYLDTLFMEVDMQAELFDRQRTVEQLHFGGGTPTYLTDEQLRALMAKLGDAFRLCDTDEREFSIEIDPRSTHDETMQLLAELGFNRVSLGVQDFDPAVQKAINREQTVEDIRRLVDDARTLDYRSVSFDLIYGLPLQNVRTFDRTLDKVVELRPDRLAVYNYAHLPQRFKGQRMIRDEDLPSPEARLEILQHTINRLVREGYVYIGMDHFALPDDELAVAKQQGTLQRNFQGYSTHGGSDLISLGVSAISKVGDSYAQNSVNTKEYEAFVRDGRLPLVKGLEVDEDDRLRAEVIHDIMCQDGLDFDVISERSGVDFRDYFAEELERLTPLASDGLIDLDERGIDVSPVGRLLLRSIAMVFDRHLTIAGNDGRFSKAI